MGRDDTTVTSEIHGLCVFGPSGERKDEVNVYCATHRALVSLDKCEGCARLVRRDEEKRHALECLPPPGGATDVADAVPVAAVMSRRALCVTSELRVDDLEGLLLDAQVQAAVVVDAERRPIGMVSKTDLLRARHEHEVIEDGGDASLSRGGVRARFGRGFHTEPQAITTIGEVMTPHAFSLTENASVARGAALLALEGVLEAPVIDGGGRVVGILSALDVMRWLAVKEGYLV